MKMIAPDISTEEFFGRWRSALKRASASIYFAEAAAQIRIAAPLILTALVNMGMSITDVVMMAGIGPVALAAGAVASDFYSLVFYLCAGVIAAVSAIVAQARGARQHRIIRRATQQAFWAALLLAVPGGVIVWQAPRPLAAIGVAPEIIDAATDYSAMMAFTLLPMLGVAVWRQFLSAFADTRVIFRVTLATLGLNAVGNYIFMFGKLGLPAMGLAGAGLSSALCALFMFIVLSVYVLRHPLLSRYRLLAGVLRLDWAWLGEIFRVGIPIGVSGLGEVGVYLLSTAVVGIFGTTALAAHAVALRMAGVLYAIPLGLSQAAAVRVGLAAGAADEIGRGVAARTALGAAFACGAIVMAIVVFTRHDVASLFVSANGGGQAIAQYAALLLLILAVTQVFEYAGTVAAGVLRGLKDTRVPMLMSVTSFWGVATLVGLGLGFGLEQQALGIWIGLGSGATVFCILLLARLSRLATYRRSSIAPQIA